MAKKTKSTTRASSKNAGGATRTGARAKKTDKGARSDATQARPGALRVRDLDVRHGPRVLLSAASFEIHAGEACIILGPNGSGKTTLLRALLGLHRQRSGTVLSSFRAIGYVPQVRHLDALFPVTIRRTLEMSFPGPWPLLSKQRRAAVGGAVAETLEYVGIAHLANQLLRECSGGQLQKALIARALVHRPDLLILDEPTNSLDQEGKRDLLALLRRFRADGTTVLMTTHEHEIAADRLFDSELQISGNTVTKEAR